MWLHTLMAHSFAYCTAAHAGDDVSKGFTVTEYAGPTPPRGTHRYIVLLYEQVGLAAAAPAATYKDLHTKHVVITNSKHTVMGSAHHLTRWALCRRRTPILLWLTCCCMLLTWGCCCLQPDGVLLPAKPHEQRAKFHADAWATSHQLGDPVAARFFKTAAGE
jgi:hypothetical protein